VLVTDREIALMSTIEEVFTSSKNLLCIWHINKNILAHIKGTFACSEEVDDFMRSWNIVCKSNSQQKYEDNWERMKSSFHPSSVEIRYVERTWIQPHWEKFIAYWTDRYHHFGTTTTSRLEGAHSRLKRYILKSTGDLMTVFYSMHKAFNDKHVLFQKTLSNERLRALNSLKDPIFFNVQIAVSRFALLKTLDELKKLRLARSSPTNQGIGICTNVMKRSLGIPCVHLLARLSPDEKLTMRHFHSQWWLVASNENSVPVLSQSLPIFSPLMDEFVTHLNSKW
jgi:hypothetical protein